MGLNLMSTVDRKRWRYWNDPEYRRAVLARQRAWRHQRYADDPGYRLKVLAEQEAWRRSRGVGPRKPRPPAPGVCIECGATFERPRSPSDGRVLRRVTCSDACANARKGRNAPKGAGSRGGRAKAPSCHVYFVLCDQCGTMFCARNINTKRCGSKCRKVASAQASLDYQRRTHVTAIRYWRVAKTPEFEAIAREYWELRQALRTRKSA